MAPGNAGAEEVVGRLWCMVNLRLTIRDLMLKGSSDITLRIAKVNTKTPTTFFSTSLLYSFEGLKKTFKDIVKFLPCSVRNFALACGTIVSVAKAAPKQ